MDDAALQSALDHHRRGELQQAEVIYRSILAANPAHAGALHFLGVLAHQAGDNDTAFQLIGHSLRIRGDDSEAWSNLALVLRARNELPEAIEACRQAIALAPGQPELHHNLASLLKSAGNRDEASAENYRAIALRPDYADALSNLSILLTDAGQLDEATALCRRALAADPRHVGALNNLGNALRNNGQLDEAAACYRKVIDLEPRQVRALNNLGVVLKQLDRVDEAVRWLLAAIAIDPNVPETYNNLATCLKLFGQYDEAIAHLEKAIALKPDYVEALNNLGMLYKDVGRLADAVAFCRRATDLDPTRPETHSNLIYAMLFDPATDQPSQHREELRYNDRHGFPAALPPRTSWRAETSRLRVGYVSPDFRHHAAASFLLPLLREHHRDRFEIHCFSGVRSPDHITSIFRNLAECWHDVAALSHDQLADLIRAQKIDILVDLTLHMADGRLPVFAHRPAPVQVTWLGYPGSTGLRAVDYRLTDPHLDPQGENDRFYTERSIQLPDTFWCYDPLGVNLPVNRTPALETGRITFGCLNNFCKISDRTLRLWSRVLRHVQKSQLMLLAPEGAARERVTALLSAEEIAADRIVFVPGADRLSYVRRYQSIDIMLDTLPYNGHTTSLDGLWMGVPLVTLHADSPLSRAGASILTNLGLSEFVAESADAFVEKAISLAADLESLDGLRQSLRSRMETSALMDAPRFASGMENAFSGMWRRHLQDLRQ